MSLPISVIILAHKQDEKLQAAVNSVGWAEEVKVIFIEEEIEDFAAVRNDAMKRAQCEWVFFLDSDEVFTSHPDELQKYLTQDEVVGVYVRRRDIFLGKEMKWGEVRNIQLLRLFKKSKGKFVRPVHEVVEVKGQTAYSNIRIDHYAHESVSSFLHKIKHYAQIEAELRKKQKQKFSLVQLLFWPTGKFIFNYCIQLGFLDGWRGLIYSVMMSIHSFAVRAYLYEKQ